MSILSHFDGIISNPANLTTTSYPTYEQRVVSNLTGLPTGTYVVEAFYNSETVLMANWQRATNVNTQAVYVQFLTAFSPTTWTGWFPITAGLAPTSSLSSMTAYWNAQTVASESQAVWSGGITTNAATFQVPASGSSVRFLVSGTYQIQSVFSVGIGQPNRWQFFVNLAAQGPIFGTSALSDADTVHEEQCSIVYAAKFTANDIVSLCNVEPVANPQTIVILPSITGGSVAGTLFILYLGPA
jgi:hypothetical protein